jgi:prepilin-type N-terminal cleavage/methylation domain-containing protein
MKTPKKRVKKIIIDFICETCDLSRPQLQITMKINKTSNAFTLIELLVVIAIIAILASIALPVFSAVQDRGKQTKDLSNGKQIALALKQFATDTNGEYPNKKYGTGTPVSDYATATLLAALDKSNDAFRWLLPVYLRSEDIFVVPGSAWNPNGADNKLDASFGTFADTLKAGECGYSYITALNDTSDPSFPLLADGWKTATIITYDNVKSNTGGVWGGQKAIVVFVDGSGQVMKCNNQTTPNATYPMRPGRAYNIFDNTASTAADPWLTATNLQLNPN